MDFNSQSFGFTLRDEQALSRPDVLWQEFGSAAGHEQLTLLTGRELAGLINENTSPALTSREVFRHLSEIATVALSDERGESQVRLSAMINWLKPEILTAAIRSEQNLHGRRSVLRRMAESISAPAVLSLAKAAAPAYNRQLSPVLLALLAKLAREADELPGDVGMAADHAFRDLFKDIVSAWSAPEATSLASEAADEAVSHAGSVAPEPRRVLEVAFESGAIGSEVWTAVARMTRTESGVRRIFDMVKKAPPGSRSSELIAQQFATPARLQQLLKEDPVDFAAVDALLARLGDGAGPAMLDALIESKSRPVRRGLLDRLATLGPNITTYISDRLRHDERWYVQRNMLTVLREAGCKVDQIPLDTYARHTDARVRREATQLLLQNPLERDRALAAALRDSDAGMLKIGLRAARANMPDSMVPILAKRVVDPTFPPEFRGPALHLLARSTSILALDTLLRFVAGGTSLFGKQKLAPRTPEMLIALGGLARHWRNERRAGALLAVARESKDPDIVKAASAQARQPQPAAEKDVLDDE